LDPAWSTPQNPTAQFFQNNAIDIFDVDEIGHSKTKIYKAWEKYLKLRKY